MWNSVCGNKYRITVEYVVRMGYGAIILSPVRIDRGAIIAAASVVSKDVPPYNIVGGCPTKLLKMRFNEDEIIEHERILIECKEMREEERTII